MDDDCSPAVRRAIAAAAPWRERLGAEAITGRHLFLALLDDEDGRAWSLLTEHGLPAALCRQRAPELPTATAPPLAEVLTHGYELARRHGEDATLTTDFFLLAVLRTDAGLADHLESLGLRLAALERAVTAREEGSIPLPEPLTIAEPADQAGVARILDAAANRAREALRVLEDYARFGLDDRFLTRELKTLRHGLAEALAGLPASLLLASRDTPGDVGTTVTTRSEQTRHSPGQVVAANAKRLQEALRSLEEFGKLFGPAFGTRLEELRYRSYTVEKILLADSAVRQRLADAVLYVLLTGSQGQAALDWTIREAAAGGAQVFQLREKELPDRELLERARRVRQWTREVGALFMLNDRPDLARLAEADGVHLGQDDLSVSDARRVVGPDALIGVSTHDIEQVRQAVRDGASYVGVGPTFPSRTKHFERFAGLDFVREAVRETTLPAFVIGGVTLDNLSRVTAAGGSRVAVSAAIACADDPRLAAIAFRQELDRARTG